MASVRFAREVKRLAATVRRIRLDRGLTQEQVAADANLVARHYQKLEAGEINPTFRTLVAVAKALNAELHELFI